MVLSLVLLFGFEFVMGKFYPETTPAEPAARVESSERAVAGHSRDGGLTDPAERAEEARDLDTALATPERLAIDGPEVAGPIHPVGARIDGLVLTSHRQTVDRDSVSLPLFSRSCS